jgi:ubiquinone/menaquinone biosynthesis C-methylase UbiE
MHTEHEHHHPVGPFFETAFAASMLLGRGRMARAVSALAELSSSDIVLDVGCGPGTAVRRARLDGAGRAIGVDPSSQMLRLARWMTSVRRTDCVGFVEGSAECIPLESGSATVVWAIQSVHHWTDRGQGLKESLRVLVSGGRLLLAERFVTPGARGRAAHGVTEEGMEELVRLVRQTGFADVGKRTVHAGGRTLVVVTASAPVP